MGKLEKEKLFKSNKNKIWMKRIVLLILSIIIVLIIKPPIKHYKVNEKFYQEHGIEYNIVQCPECGRDIADVQQFCYNCGAVLFDASEQEIEIINNIRDSLKPTKSEKIFATCKKIVGYAILIIIVYFLLNESCGVILKVKEKNRKIRNKNN